MGATCGPENEREGGEEKKEGEDECEEIAATREAMLGIVVGVEETLFLDGVEVVLPGPPWGLAVGGGGLAGAGEAGGGGLTGVTAEGGVGVGVGRGAQWALDGAGVEGVGGLLAVVGGVAGRALDVVDGAAGRAGRWGVGEAANLGVCLGEHCHVVGGLSVEWGREREWEVKKRFMWCCPKGCK